MGNMMNNLALSLALAPPWFAKYQLARASIIALVR